MRAHLDGIRTERQARRALDEIERLIAEAAAAGIGLDAWIAELAVELRAAIPEMDAEGAARLARGIADDPRRSLAAQGGLRPETVRALRP